MKVSKAIVDKRRNEIMKTIQENNSISVDDLVEKYDVSAVTIRRDLQYWEDMGAIVRNYGSASLIQEFVDDNKNYDRFRYMKAIAKRAALFVEDNDVIFINTSMTAIMMIDYIKYKNVTIITNNAKAINKAMIEHTKGKKFLLCDHTKIGLDYNYRYCGLNDVNTLITDVEVDDEVLEELANDSKVEIIKVEPLNRN